MTKRSAGIDLTRVVGFARTPDDEGWVNATLGDLPWEVDVQVETVDGQPEITGLRLVRRRESPWAGADVNAPREALVTAEALRRLPLRLLREQAALACGDASIRERLESVLATRFERPAGKPWPDGHYENIAAAYRIAVQTGQPPLKAIQRIWSVSRATAAKYVKEARERGLLGYPTRPGLAGATEQHSPITGRKPAKRRARTRGSR